MKNEILELLMTAFPTPIDPDYFNLIGATSSQILLTNEQVQKFKNLSALLHYLQEEKFILADVYQDYELHYFWNIRLTTLGFDSLVNQKCAHNTEHGSSITTV